MLGGERVNKHVFRSDLRYINSKNSGFGNDRIKLSTNLETNLYKYSDNCDF